MKIAKVIEDCNECQFAKRFNYAHANFGHVVVCTKSVRIISHDQIASHGSNIDPLEIPDWCLLEEYNGEKNISFFEE